MLTVIRGAGDLASGIALRLWRSHIQVVMTEIAHPTAIRRTVSFSTAVVHGETTVEDVTARRVETAAQALELLHDGVIPVLADPDGRCIPDLRPDAVVDAILAKRNLGTRITDAPVVIGVGPGFIAGKDCHAAVETMRGHYLGRVIYDGAALPNTDVPGLIGGYAGERVQDAARMVARNTIHTAWLGKKGEGCFSVTRTVKRRRRQRDMSLDPPKAQPTRG